MGDAEEPVPHALQLVSGAGEFNLSGLDEFSRGVHIYERGLSYAIVAIMGPQSSGKSTLLNSLFKTKFRMMDFLKGRGQTTQGIWMAEASVGLSTFTLVLDLEGTDGRERGEDDTAFEKQSTLFALAVADVIIVNMWCHDIGREHAANKPLLKTVFQVMMRLFLPRKATLLFVIRDKTRTPMESLEPILREDLERIWTSVPKPEQHKDTRISDFFNIEVTWLPNFEEKEEEFQERVGMLRDRFQRSIEPGGIAGDRTGAVPAQALPLSMEGIWERIRHNKDLDLPAHKVMVATVRCEQIADEKLQQLKMAEEWAGVKGLVESGASDLSSFGPRLKQLVTHCVDSYEQEAAYFEEKVRGSKEDQLKEQLKLLVSPVHEAALALLSRRALESFRATMKEATGGDDSSSASFAAASRECQARAVAAFEEATQGMGLPPLGLEVQSACSRFSAEVQGIAEELKKEKLKLIQDNALEFLLAGLMGKASALVEGGKRDAWQRISALWRTQLSQCQDEVEAALLGFELGQAEQQAVGEAVQAAGIKALEEKTRGMAKNALQLMKERFTMVFMHDTDGMPRRWNSSVDVHRLLHDARLASLGVMAAVAAVQLEPPSSPEGGATAREPQGQSRSSSSPIFQRLLPLLDDSDEASLDLGAPLPSDGAGEEGDAVSSSRSVGVGGADRKGMLLSKADGRIASLRLWDHVDAGLTFLSPEDCRALWKQFKKETMFQLAQALQAQEASQSTSWLPPPWAMAAMVVLGWNEFMALLRNPLLLLLLAAVYFFGRAVWAQVAGEDLFRNGLVPGLLAVSSRVVPAVLRVFQQLVEAANGQVEALQAAHQPQSQYVGHTPSQGTASGVSSTHTNGTAAAESMSTSKGASELRQRTGAPKAERYAE